MVGSQTALKAIWAALLKQPPEPAHLVRGADGTALSGGYQKCMVPPHTVGTWTTKIVRLPASGGWHAIVYTKWAEFSHDSDSFLLLAGDERDAPALHHRFLDRRSPLPLHRSWAGWLWDRGIATGEIVPLQSVGIAAYRCQPDGERLRNDLSEAVAVWRRHADRRRPGEARMDRTLRKAKARQQAAAGAKPHRLAGLLARRHHMPLLPPRRLGAPLLIRATDLLQARNRRRATRKLGEAIPPRDTGERSGPRH